MVDRTAVVGRLRALGCVAAEEEADLLLADGPDPSVLEDRLARRSLGEPPAWILGWTTFAGRRVEVDPGVYVPRPHTEELARRAAALLPAGGVAVDFCAGSGAVAVTLAATDPTATVLGLDVDLRAARCQGRNDVPAVVADVAHLPLRPGSADVVTMVAPYVPSRAVALLPPDVVRHEPRRALDGGADGLDVVRAAAIGAACVLRYGGWFLAELGGDQGPAVLDVLAAHGFVDTGTWVDEDGDLRGVAARAAGSGPGPTPC